MVRFPNASSDRRQQGPPSRAFGMGGGGGGRGRGGGYDPSSRYDPTASMSRISDDDLDDGLLDPEIDPDEALFGTSGSLGASGVRLRGGPGGGGGGIGGFLPRDSRARRRAMVFVLASGSVLAASFVISTELFGGATPGGSVGGPRNHESAYAMVPKAPKDLKRTCSEGSIGKPGGYASCQAVCVKAECCLLPKGHWFSCAEDGGKCSAYTEACSSLDEYDYEMSNPSGGLYAGAGQGGGAVVDLGPPPPGLEETCGPESLATMAGHAACMDACSDARCCTSPIEECRVSDPGVCADYEFCSVLDHSPGDPTSKVTPASHPGAVSSQVALKCHTTSLMSAAGVAACSEVCKPAMCCLADLGDQVTDSMGDVLDGCATVNNVGWCAQYAPCHALMVLPLDGAGFKTEKDAAYAVTLACDDGKDGGGDASLADPLCSNLCAAGACCAADGSGEACSTTGGMPDLNCRDYNGCHSLYDAKAGSTAMDVMVPRPPEDLEDLCQGFDFEKNVDAAQRCADACTVARCCIADIESCRVANPGMCGAYEVHCAKIWDEDFGQVEVPAPPEDLEDLCGGATSANEEAFGICDDACRPARCCDQDIEVCQVTNPEMCGAYEIHCSLVWGDEYEEVTIPDAPADIDKKCAGAGLSGDRWAECEDACFEGSCCDKDIASCKVLNPTACLPYETHCPVVWGDAKQVVSVPNAPDELPEVCSFGSDLSDFKLCDDLCYMAKCCSEDIEACEVVNSAACDAYELPCALSWGTSVTIPEAPSDIENVCTEENVLTVEGNERCQVMCESSECCSENASICKVLNPVACSRYKVCSVLTTAPSEAAIASKTSNLGGIEVPPAPLNMASLCSAKSLSNVRGFSDCEDKCDRAQCCMEDAEDCLVLNDEVCSAYEKPCTKLYNFMTTGVERAKPKDATYSVAGKGEDEIVHIMDLAQDVVESCSPELLATTQGRLHCEHLCNSRMCCFSAGADNCLDERTDECLAFAGCSILEDQRESL